MGSLYQSYIKRFYRTMSHQSFDKLLPSNQEGLERGAKLIGEGHLVSFPTETVYGLGANALDAG